MTTLSPAAAQAVAALAPFQPRSRAEVRALLSTWARRNQLTAADLRAVLDTFRARPEGA
ncbi:hypothetical protein ABZ570_09520 [Micromonospora sp. NPDC007271]|uniref:hypothetical protein n=1 Tax=Micromonospora sp. NPDC007271 TaxID=3154587 RepID=UPI0034067BCF